MINIYSYLFVGLILFLIGLLGSTLAKNIIKILISIEFMLLGVNVNFVAFASFCDNINFNGYIITLFYIGIGAVELAVALYLFYIMFQKKESTEIDEYGDL